MANILDTSTLTESVMQRMSADELSWSYNGLDCCVTFEVYDRLEEELRASPQNVASTYQFALEKSAPFLEMSMRGLLVDKRARDKSLAHLRAELAALEARFNQLCEGCVGYTINWRSPVQLKTFFYGTLAHKEIKKRNSKGFYAPTVDEDALNIMCMSFWHEPFALYVLAMRELGKKIGFLETEIDTDGRLRANINIAGTNTGRASSSMSDFGTGTNLQNVDTALRFPFVADPGMIFVNVDLEQADARNVGACIYEMFYDEYGEAEAAKYLDACESGDLHTTVCRMAWADLEWPEERKGWRAIADQPFYRQMSYRDAAKRLGHGTNYYGTPRTMAKHTQTEVQVIDTFQKRYFASFPLIPKWHQRTIELVKNEGQLTTLYGRRRHFFGRGDDQSTWRKAIAYCPQSMTAHQIDSGILNLWRHMPEMQLLIQVHDSILFQVPYRRVNELVPRALDLLRYTIDLRGGRPFYVPLEAATGWNWGKVDRDKKGEVVGNPFGLEKWKGSETRLPSPVDRFQDYMK